MAWLQLKLETNSILADVWSNILSEIGAVAITFEDAKEDPLYEPDPGTTPLWNKTRVIGLFDANTDLGSLKLSIQQKLGDNALHSLIIEPLEDQIWERAWMDQFHPMQFGQNLWICPSSETPPHLKAINIFLDPGLAFGTGTHPTTRLCLEWLDENPPLNTTLIDYGCGSGILGIAALKLGAKKVYAVDHDPQALQSTKDNVKKNNIPLTKILIIPKEELIISNKVDLILANILANPLKELAPLFTKLIKPEGILVLSGILENQVEDLLKAYEYGFQQKNVTTLNEWARITLSRNP